ncbi:MAG: hypothetical protein WD066_18475 [Planctomycetaceae bacterium]
MAVPGSSDARLYYRCAYQRCLEAEFLLNGGYTTGAGYLAGYGIECILKSLIIESTTARERGEVLRSFRGNRAHDFEWLREVYFEQGGARLTRDMIVAFNWASLWSTDLRYSPRPLVPEDAKSFLGAARSILVWADGRL